ncbi:MAG: hypothetical protein HQL23_02505 [Candidatus Omnitrophica bacterium]|nr:hypothetical protein [Candidatus Omnitrophota bacterium]
MAEQFDPQMIVTALTNCVQDAFEKKGNVTFSKEAENKERTIIEYNSRMRVFGLEKFGVPCYIAVVNFYLNQQAADGKDTCGTLVLYLEEEIVPNLARAFGQKGPDLEDPEILLEACGEMAKAITGQFKEELRAFGYKDLIASAPQKFKTDIADGVEFPYSERKYHEISFFIQKMKKIVAVICLASPRA